MKIEAISIHERAIIIRQLALTGKWRAERLGALVEMARFKTATSSVIQYSVSMGRYLIVSARAATVADAVTDINAMIAGRRPQATTGRAARDPGKTGTPPLVHHRSKNVEGSESLFGEG
jgi:hypothetical protein